MMMFKNMIKIFSKTEVQEEKTHPTYLSQTILNRLFGRVLEREGVKVSCAEHTVKNLFSYSPIHLFTFKKAAFTKPSRGTSEARDEFQSTKMLNFRCWNERCRLMRGAAFTLAEVLITLGIIGVVAAVTLPTLVQNYKKTVYVNKLKKFVSTFEQGLQKMLADEGVQRLSDLPGLGNSYGSGNSTNTKVIIDDFLSKGFHVTYKYAQGYDKDLPRRDHHIQFNDGSAIASLGSSGKNANHKTSAECDLIKSKGGTMCSQFMSFLVDVNGVKGPNKHGRDVFWFYVSDEGKLYPYGGKDYALYRNPNTNLESNQYYWNSSSANYYGCDDNFTGYGCAARIIENGWKMDY